MIEMIAIPVRAVMSPMDATANPKYTRQSWRIVGGPEHQRRMPHGQLLVSVPTNK